MLIMVGTRPEAVKVAPVVRAAAAAPDLDLVVEWTGQHGELLVPHAPGLGAPAPPVPALGSDAEALPLRVAHAVERHRPDALLAQGDTDSVLATARVAHDKGIPFVHLEAGLRSGCMQHPWPEESNRVRITGLSALHLAPTASAAANLREEGVGAGDIVVTGNTVVDQVEAVLASLPRNSPTPQRLAGLRGSPRVLFTHHRRESLPAGAEAVAAGVAAIAAAHPSVQIVMPRHPNPAVQAAQRALDGLTNVTTLPPLKHPELLWLLRSCRFAITDSGGIQEEAPSVGVPVLVTRQATERHEALERGWAQLVGWDAAQLHTHASRWLRDDCALERARPRFNPFGDGRAAPRCIQALRCWLGLSSRPPVAWVGPAAAA